MAKITKPLTDTKIKKAKEKDKEYKLSDWQGLYLIVKTNESKFLNLIFRYRKKKNHKFWVYPKISLSLNINPIESKSSNSKITERILNSDIVWSKNFN